MRTSRGRGTAGKGHRERHRGKQNIERATYREKITQDGRTQKHQRGMRVKRGRYLSLFATEAPNKQSNSHAQTRAKFSTTSFS